MFDLALNEESFKQEVSVGLDLHVDVAIGCKAALV
jgi:hypothetical protein